MRPQVSVPESSPSATGCYEQGEKEREILRLLARGETEIAAGKGYDLDDVMNEADEVLKKH